MRVPIHPEGITVYVIGIALIITALALAVTRIKRYPEQNSRKNRRLPGDSGLHAESRLVLPVLAIQIQSQHERAVVCNPPCPCGNLCLHRLDTVCADDGGNRHTGPRPPLRTPPPSTSLLRRSTSLRILLQKTMQAAQKIRWDEKVVWVLDDGNRPEVKDFAAEYGCRLITRGRELEG